MQNNHHLRLRFREDKATQAAALFLELRGGDMSYLKLQKLLYLLDRESLLRWGQPITYDSYVSMNKGPVLSQTLDLITSDDDPEHPSYWRKYISPPRGDFEVGSQAKAPVESLSPAECDLIRELFGKYGKMGRYEIVHFTHTLPEWQHPNGTSIPIEIDDILRANGYSEQEIEDIKSDLEAAETAHDLLG